MKRNWSNHQYSARLTRWLDRLAHFDIAVQHIAGRNLKFTDYLSENSIEGAPTESKYDEEYVINISTEHAKLKAKFGSIFNSQSECSKKDTETKQISSENINEQSNDQSYQNRTFQNKCHVNKTNNSENTTSGQSEISTAKTSSNTKSEENIDDKMNRENLYHWGATREIMEIIRRRNESLETRRLVERREAVAKPGTMQRRYDTQSQRMIFTPSRPNKRSREEIAEINAELTQRPDRFGGGYRPIQVEEEEEEEPEAPEERELQAEQNTVDTEEDSVIGGDNLPIVDLNKYHTDGKEAHYTQINHIVGRITENELTEENIKKAELNFMLDLKILISKTAIDREMTRVRASMRREEKDTAPKGYRQVFDKLSIRWGLVFVDDQIAVPIDLRRKLIEILHFGLSETTKMISDGKIFWWPEMRKNIEQKVKDCTACLAT